MYLEGLDDIDKKIINLLIHNARISYVDIGKSVNLSRVAVKSRIQNLEEKGIIEEYTTIINPQKISNSVSSYFEIEFEPSDFKNAIDILNRSEIITQIYHVSGKSKLHVHAIASSNEELNKLLNDVVYTLPGIINFNSNIILSSIKDIKGLRL